MSSSRRPPSSASSASARRTAMSSLGIQRRSIFSRNRQTPGVLGARLPRARSPAAVNPLRGSFAPLRPFRVTAAADRAGSSLRASRVAGPRSTGAIAALGEPLVCRGQRRRLRKGLHSRRRPHTPHAAPTRSTGTLVDTLERRVTSRISTIRCDTDRRNLSPTRRYAPTSVHLRRNPRSRSPDSAFTFTDIRNRQAPLEIDGEILRFAALQLGTDAETIHAYAGRQQTVSEHQQRIGEYVAPTVTAAAIPTATASSGSPSSTASRPRMPEATKPTLQYQPANAAYVEAVGIIRTGEALDAAEAEVEARRTRARMLCERL